MRLKIDELETKVEHVDGLFGTCYFIDCFEGIKFIKEKSFDLAISDIPWGNDYKPETKEKMGHVAMCKPRDQIEYDDSFNPERNLKFLNAMKYVSKAQVLCTGEKHAYWWIRNSDPIGTIHIILRNSYSASHVSIGNYHCPYFVYGEPNARFKRNVMEESISYKITQEMGFLRKITYDHPNAKDEDLWAKIVKEMEANSIFDCCIGSGVVPEVGEMLQIPWLGFEIDSDCFRDIKRRIRKGNSVKLW